MSVAPDPFDKINSISDARKTVAGKVKLYKTKTIFSTQMNDFPSTYANYVIMAKKAKSKAEQSAIAGQMITETLRSASPVVAQTYLISEKAQKFFFNYFHNMTEDLKYSDFMGKDASLTDPSLGNLYLKVVKDFRDKMYEELGAINGAELLVGSPKARISVGNHAGDILEMLEHMQEVWARRNNTQRSSINKKDKLEFIAKGLDALSGNFDYAIISPFSKELRATEGFGVSTSFDKDGKVKFQSAENASLLSAALAGAKSMGLSKYKYVMDNIDAFLKIHKTETEGDIGYNRLLLSRIVEEVALMEKSNDNGEGGFRSQMMNIDPIFLTFYVIYKVSGLTVKEFYAIQRYLYAACRELRGANQLSMILSRYSAICRPLSRFLTKMSASTDIYLPPWVLKLTRLYDVAAVICPCDCANFDITIDKPAISWRYLLSVKTTEPGYFDFLVNLWHIEKLEDNLDNIYSSERALQQAIVGRQGPLQNTNFIEGSALNVEVVGANDKNSRDDQRGGGQGGSSDQDSGSKGQKLPVQISKAEGGATPKENKVGKSSGHKNEVEPEKKRDGNVPQSDIQDHVILHLKNLINLAKSNIQGVKVNIDVPPTIIDDNGNDGKPPSNEVINERLLLLRKYNELTGRTFNGVEPNDFGEDEIDEDDILRSLPAEHLEALRGLVKPFRSGVRSAKSRGVFVSAAPGDKTKAINKYLDRPGDETVHELIKQFGNELNADMPANEITKKILMAISVVLENRNTYSS